MTAEPGVTPPGDDSIEEGEMCVFPDVPWLHDSVGSMLEARLFGKVAPGECRLCRKKGSVAADVEPEKQFCSRKCEQKWDELLEVRTRIGLHDLRRRGYD